MPDQKLFSIPLYFSNTKDANTPHSHLDQEIQNGWRVVSTNLACAETVAWLTVLLEKTEDE